MWIIYEGTGYGVWKWRHLQTFVTLFSLLWHWLFGQRGYARKILQDLLVEHTQLNSGTAEIREFACKTTFKLTMRWRTVLQDGICKTINIYLSSTHRTKQQHASNLQSSSTPTNTLVIEGHALAGDQ